MCTLVPNNRVEISRNLVFKEENNFSFNYTGRKIIFKMLHKNGLIYNIYNIQQMKWKKVTQTTEKGPERTPPYHLVFNLTHFFEPITWGGGPQNPSKS